MGQRSLAICFANVYNVMLAHDSPSFRAVMRQADIVNPDGMPLVWALKILGHHTAQRVYGPDFTRLILARAEQDQIPVGFYGSTPETLTLLLDTLRRLHPRLDIRYSFSPPFRPLTPAEDAVVINSINASGAAILFIGLGTPKQEEWMAQHRGLIQCVMLGVGAAFDFLSGAKPQAPRWMMRLGLEWLFRLCSEPRRLWKRYLKHNPRFVYFFLRQLLRPQ